MSSRTILFLLITAASVLALRGEARVWHLGEAEGMPQTRVYCVIQTRDGYIWMATRDGLVRFDGSRAAVYKTRPSDRILPGNHFRHIYENDRGELCAKIDETYYLFDREAGRFDTLSTPPSPPRRQRVPDSISATIESLPQFRGRETRVLFHDRQDGWWVESSEGISRVLFTPGLPSPAKENGDGEETVRGLMADRRGYLWTADKNGYVKVDGHGSTRWLGADGKLHSTRVRFGHSVYSFLDHDSGIWIGTKPDGLYLWRGDSLTHISGIAGNGVYAIAADRHGHIFTGTYDGGLSVIHDPGSTRQTIQPVKDIPGIRALHIGKDNLIYAGTDHGLFTIGYSGGRATVRDRAIEGSVIMDIAPGATDDELVAATYGDGLIRLDTSTGEVTTVTTADGLASDICLSLTKAPDGRYIVTSEHSLSVYTDGDTPVRTYGPELFGGTFAFTEGRPIVTPDGTTVAGTTQGTLSFVPDRDTVHVPRLVFSCPDTLRLGPDSRRLDVSFAVLDYNRFTPVRYAWKADGDERWHLTDGRLTFADIRPGITHITVRATDGHGAWTAGPRTLVIDREPRFAERRWFWIAVGIIAAAMLYGLARLAAYVLRLRREVMSLTIQKGEMMEYFNARLHDMMRSAPAARPASTTERSLMERVNEYLEENYNNPDIGIDSLCEHLAMSHTRLYREIKEASGMTPANLIITFRISKAAGMLESGRHNVSEVAYACGWSDPKYFSRVFRKFKGCAPSDYLKSCSEEV